MSDSMDAKSLGGSSWLTRGRFQLELYITSHHKARVSSTSLRSDS